MFTRKACKQSIANSFTKCMLTFLTAVSKVSSQTEVKKNSVVVSDCLLVFQLCRLWLLFLWKVRSPDIFHEWPAFSDQKHSSNGVEYDDTGYHHTNFPTYFVVWITSHHKRDGSLVLSKSVDFGKTISERTRELSYRTPFKDQKLFMSLMFAKGNTYSTEEMLFLRLKRLFGFFERISRALSSRLFCFFLVDKACKCL